MPQVARLQVETAHSICVRVIQLDRNQTLNVMALDLYAVHLPIPFLQSYTLLLLLRPSAGMEAQGSQGIFTVFSIRHMPKKKLPQVRPLPERGASAAAVERY
jgi:hypothetical protein